MQFICYKKCTTCKGVEKLLEEKGIDFEKRDIKEDNPTKDEIREWHKRSGLDLKRFYNTSGMVYRENNIKEKRAGMSEEDQYELLSTDGMLVKRPILLVGDEVYVGPDVKKYVEGL